MHLIVKTPIPLNYRVIAKAFDLKLFKALRPPLLSLEVERFDGCKKGDEIHLEIGLGPLKQKWIGHITSDHVNEIEDVFVDEGKLLPPPLKSWTHTHRILKIDENSSEIHDDIEYSTGNAMLDLLLYPAILFQFVLRKPIYRRYFKATK